MKKTVINNSVIYECIKLANLIETKKVVLTEILLSIESQETIDDELFKSIDALKNISTEGITNFMNLGYGAAFFPINLPLYSLIIFGVIPGIFAENMFIRPPMLMQDITEKIFNVLSPYSTLVQKIILCNCNRTEFIKIYVNKSKFILFTGTLKNANIISSQLKQDQLFIFNGQGINPIVVGSNANLNLAIEKTCLIKRFNSGQDCAAADSIFIHTEIYEKFKKELIKAIGSLKVGYYRENTQIGPLVEPIQTVKAAEHIFKFRDKIIYGGNIDFKNSIVMPTVIESSSIKEANLKELFSPIWHICKYKNEEDLKQYFEHPSYKEYAMYVSVFGNSEYISSQKHSIVLQDTTIIDIEKGNKEYGGYSTGASFVQYRGEKCPRPILISRELIKILNK